MKSDKNLNNFTLSRSPFFCVNKPFAVNAWGSNQYSFNTIIFTRFILNICKHVEKCLNPPEKREIIQRGRKNAK